MVDLIYPPELQYNKAFVSNTEEPFFYLHVSVSNGFVSSKKNYDRREFYVPNLDSYVSRRTSNGMDSLQYIM